MKYLEFEKRNRVGLLKINRPKALNALNLELLKELEHCLEEESEKLELVAMIVTGAGEKAFIAGADIKEMQGFDKQQILSFISLGQRVSLLLEKAPFITIAAINGFALGGGLEMALACDFIYAADSAKLGLPEVMLGIIPGFGGTQRLVRAVGVRQAKEMIATGKAISADEAHRIGLVNCVCSKESLISECLAVAGSIAGHSQTAIYQAKDAINREDGLSIHEGLDLEKSNFAICFETPEREKAMQAFLEKSMRGTSA
ncbi:enoyl-CoA hydratase/isomerase family protein [Waddlia chondrophila]|uniref:3-hydroxybutyryl-CoA dehydratase n=1 Tax=Waddlia chondrophila (strain ATCC VR-1470 / WSU 86-1044) TaxID=716544 RepID=D6YRX7_WADCW|nr:enoyl-CoA hydratase-related protein [Waddlia chondrophila]ADI38822.1 3-hydroxybutyryl-CoA dehydratase [Waddlia chondrophila WSU 86-1044]